MRDYTRLRAYELADNLALDVYKATASFPKHELFGLAHQMRKAAVSCASNIVEGSARHSEVDFLRFLDIAYGSACEIQYQLSLAERLGYLPANDAQALNELSAETARVLNGLIRSMRRKTKSED